MTVSELLESSRLCRFLALLIFIVHAQKRIFVDDNKLNVLVVGDIGVRASESAVKEGVVRAILLIEDHQSRPFQLGINPGGNEYPHGSKKDELINLRWIFELSFPSSVFPFDFLTVPGQVDYEGDVLTQIRYHQDQKRFYMPDRNFIYDVELRDGSLIRFVCIDSTPLFDPELSRQYNA
ncbi:hypothetical protein RF11_04914 [Thelohanellus kitauei]|uniref:Uncharacterized protein n=1 Tax=Thelohanellus kitauei TaxID=669202 RepID=A0A0C2N597_THEKT|nr:hypothetical protein RF11_04914 [Thelohanellus kitauei]